MLTSDQQAAVRSIGRKTTVSAGAGAGKTRVMVHRYLEIIQQSRAGLLPEDQIAGVGNILTITFTEDAAAELKKRLVRELEKADLRDERRQVETAYISTIHGFCSRLLKENPFEAGLDPQFTVLNRGENTLLQEEAFQQVVEEGFAGSRPEVMGLFRAFSSTRRFGDSAVDPIALLRRETSSTCDMLRSLGWRRDRLAQWLQRGETALLTAGMELVVARINEILSEVARLVSEMRMLPTGAECAIETARREMIGCEDRLAPLPDDAGPEAVAEKVGALKSIRIQAGKTSSVRQADQDCVAHLKDRFVRIRDLVDAERLVANFDGEFEEQSARQSYWLLQMVGDFWDNHDALKRSAGALDFNDLQSYARDLLDASPSVLDRYRRRLRHLMVDEFQDTDGLQKQILDLLENGRNLFCVGDPKQSIYGFRNADVTIFRDLIQSVRRSDPDRARHLPMHENFRCRPEIIDLVNHVFAAIGVGSGIEYEALVSRAAYGEREDPSLEILLSPGQDRAQGDAAADPEEDGHTREAELVARRIRQMVAERQVRITAEGADQGRPLEFRDFLILLRSFTHLREYEQALSRQGVDYYIVGGRGYYALQEIRDIRNVLQVIRNPLDDVALAAALRSPFCGLSDEGLYILARIGQASSSRCLHEGIRQVLHPNLKPAPPRHPVLPGLLDREEAAPLPSAVETSGLRVSDQDMERLGLFWMVIESIRQQEDRTRITAILERLLGETLYEARLLLQPGGRRKMANVRKLVASASTRDTCGVAEFLHWLVQQRRVEEKEGEAPTEEEAANVVRIRTIHNSKGLESNVVVVGAFSRKTLNTFSRPLFLFDVETGAGGCQYPHHQSFKTRQSATYAVLSKLREQKENDEALRLLYVAMTRAREYLILAGSFPASPQSWATRVLPSLGINSIPTRDEEITAGNGIRIVVRPKVAGHRIERPVTRDLIQKIQARMRALQPLDPADLQNLENLSRAE